MFILTVLVKLQPFPKPEGAEGIFLLYITQELSQVDIVGGNICGIIIYKNPQTIAGKTSQGRDGNFNRLSTSLLVWSFYVEDPTIVRILDDACSDVMIVFCGYSQGFLNGIYADAGDFRCSIVDGHRQADAGALAQFLPVDLTCGRIHVILWHKGKLHLGLRSLWQRLALCVRTLPGQVRYKLRWNPCIGCAVIEAAVDTI